MESRCGIAGSTSQQTDLHLPIKTSPLTAFICPTLSSAQELDDEPDVEREGDRAAALGVGLPLLFPSTALLVGA